MTTPHDGPSHEARSPLGGERYNIDRSRAVITALHGGIMALTRVPEEAPAAAAYVQTVNEYTPLIVERLVSHETTQMPHGVELGRHIAALQQADENLGGSPVGLVELPHAGVNRDELRALLVGQFDFVRALGRANRTAREDAALAMVNVYSAVVEANPDGLWLDEEAGTWLQQIANAFLIALPNYPEQ
ncbi:MAG TPA: hypothetical protein VLF40_02935 [Candidatus Saccharimonadales bacterium]|nr:hypothetical protein [Candidatus Saccharimonadales bacterium]